MISTQADRLQEIIVVDDASDPPLERFAKADEYKVRFIVHDAAVGLNDSDHEHAPSPTDVFAAEPYERSPKKKQRVA